MSDPNSSWQRALQERYGPFALVTGASDGIGRAMAMLLAEAGFGLVITARRQDALEELAGQLRARHGIEVRVIAADLASEAGIEAVLAEAGRVDIGLFVAAAGFGTSGAFLDNSAEDEIGMLDVNCRAVLAMTHAQGRRLAERGRGGIVLLSSVLAFQGTPHAANYAATKAYIQALAEGLALELKPMGVDVLASAPGPTRSGFAARAGMTMSRMEDPAIVARETLRALGRRGTVRPGPLSKLLGAALSTAPRALRVRILAGIMGGMARRDREEPRRDPRPA